MEEEKVAKDTKVFSLRRIVKEEEVVEKILPTRVLTKTTLLKLSPEQTMNRS